MRSDDPLGSVTAAADDLEPAPVEPPLEPEDKLTPEAFGPVAWRLILELAETDPAIAWRLRREGVLSEESADEPCRCTRE